MIEEWPIDSRRRLGLTSFYTKYLLRKTFISVVNQQSFRLLYWRWCGITRCRELLMLHSNVLTGNCCWTAAKMNKLKLWSKYTFLQNRRMWKSMLDTRILMSQFWRQKLHYLRSLVFEWNERKQRKKMYGYDNLTLVNENLPCLFFLEAMAFWGLQLADSH